MGPYVYDPDPYPKPVADPAGDGLPETADDDSHADEERDAIRIADGPDPVPLPPDREDGPMAVEDYGTTAAEKFRGEPLQGRLAREAPDFDPDALPIDPDPLMLEDALDDEAVDRVDEDTEILAEEEPVDPNLDSEVSMYDRDVPGISSIRRVGRLVQPDEGAQQDTEADEVAYDAGLSGGGFSAEESAIHEIPPNETSA